MKNLKLKDLKIIKINPKHVRAKDTSGFKINFPICRHVQISKCKKFIRTSDAFYKTKKAGMKQGNRMWQSKKTEGNNVKIIKFERVFESESKTSALTFETESLGRAVPSVESTRALCEKQPEPGGLLSAEQLKALRKKAGLRF